MAEANSSNALVGPSDFVAQIIEFANSPQLQQGVTPSNYQFSPFAFADPPFQQRPGAVDSPFSFANRPFSQGAPNAPPHPFSFQNINPPPPQLQLPFPPPPLPQPQQSFPPPQQPFLPPQPQPHFPPPQPQQPFPQPPQPFPLPQPQQPFPPPDQPFPQPQPQQHFPPPQPQQPFPPPQQPFLSPQPQQPFPPPQPQLPFPPPQPQQPFPPPPQQPFPPPQPQQPFPPPQPQQPFPPPPQQPFPPPQPQQPFPPPQQPLPSPPIPPPVSSGTITNECHQYLDLNQAISRGNLNDVKAFLDERPEATTAKILDNGMTALQFACSDGQVEIVKELLRRMSPDDLLAGLRDMLHTPLTVTAINGNIEIAEALVEKNPKLTEIPGRNAELPVVAAVCAYQKVMARYLYSKTPLDALLAYNGYHGTLLLSSAIFYKMLDIALHLFEACPRLAITINPVKGATPICVLACRPNLFPSGSQLGLWKGINVKLPSVSFEPSDQARDDGLPGSFLLYLSKFFGINQIYNLKKTHLQAQKLLQGISKEASLVGFEDRSNNRLFDAMMFGVRFGTVEFVVEMIRTNPEFLWLGNIENRSLFLVAVQYRREKIFSLLYGLGEKKAQHVADIDAWLNGMLHLAGFLAPPTRLDNIPGPALQLQRELQWFKEVERVVPEVDAEKLNAQGMKPRELFTACHANLQKEAEKWMKKTATSCSLVAALIITVTFAAAFTVPGGTDSNFGNPLRMKDIRFTFFVISNIISFFASCTSVLIFLGILTARYSEDDFLVLLPTKMIAGLTILLVSIAAMLLAFSWALFTLLNDKSWIVIPVILLACLPVGLFVLLQYPLLVQMIVSTYGRGIFNRKMKPWR